MEFLVTVLGWIVIICLLGALLFTTKAIKARKAGDMGEKKKYLSQAGVFFTAYCAANLLRIFLEGKMG